jgi:hypothetical protein
VRAGCLRGKKLAKDDPRRLAAADLKTPVPGMATDPDTALDHKGAADDDDDAGAEELDAFRDEPSTRRS